MNTQFPLKLLLEQDVEDIAKKGFPYFDHRCLKKDEPTLVNLCISKILSTPSLINSRDLELLPSDLLDDIYIKVLQTLICQATKCIFPWMNSSKNPQKKTIFSIFLMNMCSKNFL